MNLKIRDNLDTSTFNALHSNGLINTTVKDVKTTQAMFYGFLLHNPNASEAWVQCFFKPASEVQLGNHAPDFTIKLSASGSVAWDFHNPIRATQGLSVAATTTETGSTATTTGLSGVFYFK